MSVSYHLSGCWHHSRHVLNSTWVLENKTQILVMAQSRFTTPCQLPIPKRGFSIPLGYHGNYLPKGGIHL